MRAMVLSGTGPVEDGDRLELRELEKPAPGKGQVLVRVQACAVCRTDLHIVEGELVDPKPNLVPGHQIVGVVEAVGEGARGVELGERVGVPWLGGVDGVCAFCRSGRENLCDAPTFTGFTVDGGYAEYAVARADFVFPVPAGYGDVEAAPLLCAGLIGYRALRLAEVEGLDGPGRLGLWGFGNAAQIVIQVARRQGRDAYVYTRGDAGQRTARELGALWAGGGEELPPVALDSVIIFASVGDLVPHALRSVRKGGIVVCAGIHMTPIHELEYELLWGERVVRSVANLTRRDGEELLALAGRDRIETRTQTFPLEQANEALRAQKAGTLEATAVLVP